LVQLGSRPEIKHTTERAGDIEHSIAAIDRLCAARFTAISDFRGGLKATINSLMETETPCFVDEIELQSDATEKV